MSEELELRHEAVVGPYEPAFGLDQGERVVVTQAVFLHYVGDYYGRRPRYAEEAERFIYKALMTNKTTKFQSGQSINYCLLSVKGHKVVQGYHEIFAQYYIKTPFSTIL